MANRRGNSGNSDRLFSCTPKSLRMVTCSHEIKICLLLGRKAMTNLNCIKKQRHYFADKGPHNQSYSFSSSHIWMWELDHKESWVPKNRCFWNVVVEKTLESPLDCKEIKPVNPKGNQSWVFIGGWSSNTLATWCEELTHWKRPWCWERLMAGGEGDNRRQDGWMASLTQWTRVWQGSLACCNPWGLNELDMTEWLSNNNNMKSSFLAVRERRQAHGG